MSPSVYFFGEGKADGTRDMKAILGGKGANLAEMTNLGVPVPPGFTIACSVCIDYLRARSVPDELREEEDADEGEPDAQPAALGPRGLRCAESAHQ